MKMYELDYASNLAARLTSVIRPYCDAVAVAGSIRRKKPKVKDIDMVIIPNSLTGLVTMLVRLSAIEFLTKRRIDSKTKIIKVRFHTILVDIYLADKETFPMIFLVRTGSAGHNQMLAGLAKKKGLKFKANGEGILDGDGRRISGDTEESIFEVLGLEYVPPEERE